MIDGFTDIFNNHKEFGMGITSRHRLNLDVLIILNRQSEFDFNCVDEAPS